MRTETDFRCQPQQEAVAGLLSGFSRLGGLIGVFHLLERRFSHGASLSGNSLLNRHESPGKLGV